MSIAHKTVKGGIWSLFSKFAQQISSIIVTIILARLLKPEDFGLIAMVNVYIAFINIFSNLGLGAAVVNKHTATQQQLSSIYWITLFTSLLSTTVIILSAPIAVIFYNEPQLYKLIILLSANPVIGSLFIIQRKLTERNLDFAAIAKGDVYCVIGSSIVGIVTALGGLGVYSLIAQSLSLNIFYLSYYRYYQKWRADYSYSYSEIKEMVKYALKYKGAAIANYFERNIDYVILGKFFDAVTLGYYSFTYNIMYFPVKRISYVFTEILFPAFSSLKHDIEKVVEAYLKSSRLISIITFPLMVLIAIYSKPIIYYVFGEKWLPAVTILSIIAIAGAIQSIDQLIGVLLASVNRETVFLNLNIFRLCITALTLYVGTFWGINGVAWAILVSKLILFIFNQLLLKKYYNIKLITLFKNFYGPFWGCIIMVIAYICLENFLVLGELFLLFVVKAMITITVYCISIILTNFCDFKYIHRILRPRVC